MTVNSLLCCVIIHVLLKAMPLVCVKYGYILECITNYQWNKLVHIQTNTSVFVCVESSTKEKNLPIEQVIGLLIIM